jgi:monovalent cation/proton antiporter MnhG/PhaG subunit
MKTTDVLVDVFLVLGVAGQLICCLGVLVFRDVFDRLHFSGAGTIFGPLLIGAAVLTRETTSAARIATIVIIVLVPALGPAVLIATARAARRLEHGRVEPAADERRRR